MQPGFSPSEIDTSRPHPARLYSYYLGGKDNYMVDREAAMEVLRAAPDVHEVAQEIAPDVRVAYVDNDPIVHVHACALLTGDGYTSIVLGDLREPEAIIAHPRVRELIDFSQPVAVLLVAILHFIKDDENPARIIAAFHDAMPPGSYLALSHGTADFHAEAAVSQATAVYDRATA